MKIMTTQIKTMRDAVIEQIYNKILENDRIFFLSEDFGAPSLDKIRKKFKDRFINVGIAEQNAISLAVGLSLEGFIVYVYGIAPFLTMRAYEQIRVNLSMSSQLRAINVNLIGVGAGLSYDVSGPTHHCLEDISIMRLLPNFIIFSPSDWVLAKKFVDSTVNIKKPKYMRLDGKPLPQIYNESTNFNFSDGYFELAKGTDFCIVSTGYMTHVCLKVANTLLQDKIRIGIIDAFLLKPLNEASLFNILRRYEVVLTAEEAFINKGGLDTLILNILNDNNSQIKLKKIGFDEKYIFRTGSRSYLHKLGGLDEEGIINTIKKLNRVKSK